MPGSVIHVYHESAEALAARIRAAAPEREVIALADPAALAAALPEIEILFAPMPPRTGWARATRLRLVQLLGAGVDQLLPSPDLPASVEVAGVRGLFAADVAEHALALMLQHARGLARALDDQRARRFAPRPHPTLAGARLVIVGHGAVGRHLARVARALEMEVTAVSRTGRAVEPVEGVVLVPADALPAVLGDARYVVVCVPLTPATRYLFDAAMLARLGPDAFLVNVARGGIVDEEALARALEQGRLGGAALDVFEDEPLPADSPLWSVPDLTITPHVAGLGEHYVDRCVEVLLANARAVDTGVPRVHLVDRGAGY